MKDYDIYSIMAPWYDRGNYSCLRETFTAAELGLWGKTNVSQTWQGTLSNMSLA